MEGDLMYTKSYQVHSYEVNKENKLKLSSLFHYLQDVMIENANSYGASSAYHHKRNLAWVLIDYEIDLFYRPSVFDVVTCGTLPYSFKKYYGYRIYEVFHEDKLVAKGKARFVLMDFQNKTLSVPSQDILDLFTDALKEPKSLPLSKHKPYDKTLLAKKELRVKLSDLDLNNHMNNVKYIEHALDSLEGLDFDLDTLKNIRVTYKKECVLQDELTLLVYQDGTSVQVQFLKGPDVLSLVTLRQ